MTISVPDAARRSDVGPVRVHQFHSGSAYGDAVTNSMFLINRHLRGLGYEGEVFVEHLDPQLIHSLSPWTSVETVLRENDLLLIHHSMGHDRLAWLLSLKCRKVLVYHNITPAEFFPEGSAFREYATLGREQLIELKGAVERTVAVSFYNATELSAAGFAQVDVIPALVDDRKFSAVFAPKCRETGTGRPWTVLFVGRVCQNKGHGDLIEAALRWRALHPAYPIRFVCVGALDLNDSFCRELVASVESLGLNDKFQFTGKLSDEELLDWYARADCYLSLSRHEGFGVPLIEAMFCRLPVVALAEAAVPETLAGAGVLLESADPDVVCRELFGLMRNRKRARALLVGQDRRAADFSAQKIRGKLAELLGHLGLETPGVEEVANYHAGSTTYRVEGPCESSYSLALVNRELAAAVSRKGADVAMFCTEGPGDYTPDPTAVAALAPSVQALIRAGRGTGLPRVVVRNLYPPRVRDARAEIAGGYFFWEETSFPAAYVRDFNLSLDLLLAPSATVADAWRSSGVNVPIRYVGSGADHVLNVPSEPHDEPLPEGFKFLHVSSCFPRKGPDVLLRAFGEAFSGRTDVSLVIKTFDNPHNEVPQLLASLKAANPRFPRVVLISKEFTPGQIRMLYEQCDAYVAPSRGEGFGLPMAEAMLHGLPVIATGWGGHTDFCRPDTAWLIDYRMAPSASHVAGSDGSLWAEPDVDSLVEQMRQVERGEGDLEGRRARAKALIESDFSWDKVAARFVDAFEADLPTRDTHADPIRLAWVSTWNEPCGIATYSNYLLEHLDDAEVQVCVHGRMGTSQPSAGIQPSALWRDANQESLDGLVARILDDRSEVAVFQFNFGFFSVPALAKAVADLERADVRVIVVMHSTQDVDRGDFRASLRNGVEGLATASRLLVHSVDDLNRLIDFGLGANAAFFPHGAMDLETKGMARARERLQISSEVKIVATYGFMLPHKGLPEILQAMADVCRQRDDVYFFMVNSLYPADVSKELMDELATSIQLLGIADKVRMFTDFLPEAASLALLEVADVVAFPYQDTAESASGAVRFGLAARRPVAVTPLAIFSDLNGNGLRFSSCRSADITADLLRWLSDEGVETVVDGQNEWISARSWPNLMSRLVDISRGLLNDAAARRPLTASH